MNQNLLFIGAALLTIMFLARNQKTPPEELEFINFEDLPSKRGPVFTEKSAAAFGLNGPGDE